jgi:DNA-binding NarL/FixJ family response regulator
MRNCKNIKIFLADDHPLMRTGLRHSLSVREGFEVIGEASDGYTAIEKISKLRPDIALIDMDMPGLSGNDVIRIFKKTAPELKLLILSTYSDKKFVSEAMRAGADGYILKNVPIDELEKILRELCDGNSCFSPYLINLTTEDEQEYVNKKDNFNLTTRETEILHALSEGMSNKEISSKLFISVETVKSHVKNIYKKLDVKNRVEAVRLISNKNFFNI